MKTERYNKRDEIAMKTLVTVVKYDIFRLSDEYNQVPSTYFH